MRARAQQVLCLNVSSEDKQDLYTHKYTYITPYDILHIYTIHKLILAKEKYNVFYAT